MVDYTKVHANHHKDRNRRIINASKILHLVKQVLPFNSMLDVGCGIGAWMASAKNLGVEYVEGIEGPWIDEAEELLVERSSIQRVDLSESILSPTRKYELAISIEVAEHLPESMADSFCAGLVAASDSIVFSAAIPGQRGRGHINEQYIEYWLKKFWMLGFVPLDNIRPWIQSDENMYWWFKQNIVCLVRYDKLLMNPELQRFALPLSAFQRVHHVRYARIMKERTRLKKKLKKKLKEH